MLRHLLTSISTIAILAAASCGSAAILFNSNLTDTIQIRSATNNPYFASGQVDVVGVNYQFTNTVASGSKVRGIGFDNIDLFPNGSPYALSENGVPATMTAVATFGSFNGRERNQSLNASGLNDTVLETVANEKYYVQTGETITMTFSGLTPSTNVLVQAIGGDSGDGWTGQFRVSANGNVVGDWTAITDQDITTASLFTFDTTTTAGGTLTLAFNTFTGSYASLAGLIISESLPPVPEPSSLALLGIGAVGLIVKARRRRANA